MPMHLHVERLASFVLVASAVTMASVVVKRELGPSVGGVREPELPRYVSGWEQAVPVGHPYGDPAAPVTILEFVDLECPVCAVYDSTLRRVVDSRPGVASLRYVHLPLPQHRFALPAARLVECAALSSQAASLIGVLLRKQDSLGLKSWASYWEEAGITAAGDVERCVSVPSSPRIEAGIALAKRFEVRGTPTMILNGWLLHGIAQSGEQLITLVDSIHHGALDQGSSPKEVARVLRRGAE